MTSLNDAIDGALTEKPVKKRGSHKKLFVGVALAIVLVIGVSAVYANNLLPGFTTTSTTVVGSSTSVAFQTVQETSFTSTQTVLGQNTTIVQPAVLVYTSTVTVTLPGGTTTVTSTTWSSATTITNSTTTTIDCIAPGNPPGC